MKDLKHIYELEKLLEDVNHDLVRQATSEGRIAIGNVCSLIPEPLLNLPGCFAVRLRAPRTGSMEMGTYYMTSLLCEFCRSLLERAIEGGFDFLDCIIAPDACAQMNRAVENMERQQLCTKENFFVSYADVPMKSDETALRHYVKQMRIRVLEPLHEVYGIDVSDYALREAVRQQNEISRLITAIGEYRKEKCPRITGYEFAVLCLATYSCPQDYLVPILQETLEELQGREPDETNPYRARVVLVGSEIDDPSLIHLIEDVGALVVADRFCFGSFPGRQVIELNDHEDVLTQICRQYLEWGQCPRFMNTDKVNERQTYVNQLAKDFHADGIIYEHMKFCDYWGYESALESHVMRDEYHYPVLSVDRPYVVGNSGQLRTRVQAFIESMEIKKIQKGADHNE